LAVTFVVAGIWHGAGWKYICFGFVHAAYMSSSTWTLRWRDRMNARLGIPGTVVSLWRGVATFALVSLSFIFFRAGGVEDALLIYERIFTLAPGDGLSSWEVGVALAGAGLSYDLLSKFAGRFADLRTVYRWAIYYVLVGGLAVATYRTYDHERPFIYFQF
jgi:D-alanyl-lipoteichoic acid acyltransferase DltB (MBOAT superfamily)